MQGKRQGDLQFLLRKATYLGHQTAGGDRDTALRDIEPVLIAEKADKTHHIVVIIHGLAASHHDDIGDALSELFLDFIDLCQHLSRRQIARKAVYRRGAKTAAHAATDLRTDTDRIPVGIAHQYTFYHIAVRERKQIFLRSVVFGDLHNFSREARETCALREFFPEALREIAHLLKARRLLLMQPGKNLFRAKSRFSERFQIAFQFVLAE